MNKVLLKFSLVCVTGAILVLSANPKPVFAQEEGIAGFTPDKLASASDTSYNNFTTVAFSTNSIPMPGFTNIGIADVASNLMIRSGPGEGKKILGKLPKDGGCDILESDDGSGWTKISSGKITGYVKTEYLITGSKATELAKKVGNYVAVANIKDKGLNVRKEATKDSDIVDQIAYGEELLVLDAMVVSYGEEYNKWVQVSLDGEGENGQVGYVAKEFVDLSYSLKKAVSIEELDFGTGVSSLRANLVNYAKQFLGNRYDWGGTSLNNGVDCSGFTMRVYEKYGHYIPRNSRSQAGSGTTISSSKLKPGDLVFYGKSGYISHVAIYIGNSKVIHASNPRDGIKISNMYYRNPIKCVRYINE